MDNGMYVHFSNAIIYLGFVITTFLCDSKDIAAQIIKAYGTMGAPKEFFSRRDIPLNIKLKLYIAIPLNTMIWAVNRGCT
jgi:hypothetical protein